MPSATKRGDPQLSRPFHHWHISLALATTNTSHPMQNLDYLLEFHLWRIPSVSVCMISVNLTFQPDNYDPHPTLVPLSIIGGNCHKYHFCQFLTRHTGVVTKHVFFRDKSMLVLTKVLSGKKLCLSRQNLSRDNTFVATFVATKHVFCRNKSMLVETKLLSRQTQKICSDKNDTFASFRQ